VVAQVVPRFKPPSSPRREKEQLLAIDPVAGDRGLALRRDKPIDECLAEFFLHRGKFFGIDQHDAVLIEQPLVAFDDDFEIAAFLNDIKVPRSERT